MKPGRKSTAELSIFVPGAKRLPCPPLPELSAEQAAVWADVVGALPDGWVQPAANAVLVELCRRVCRSRMLEEQIRRIQSKEVTKDSIKLLRMLFEMADRESKGVLAACRSLRINPAALKDPRTAGRQQLNHRAGPYPWNDA